MRPLRHNFLEVVSWVAAFFCSVLGNACFKSIANAKKRNLYSVYFPRISHPCWHIAFANVRLSEMQRVLSCHRISP